MTIPGTGSNQSCCLALFLACLLCQLGLQVASGFSMMEPPIPVLQSHRRLLPERLLIGYATGCDEKVVKAVREGVNVVIWAFLDIRTQPDGKVATMGSLDLECIRQTIARLDNEGYDDTVHLVSFGGWNGGHFDPHLTAEDWYQAWKDLYGDIFHGLDWDQEGHDDLDSPTNFFTLDCLEKMGRIARLAREDGYIVGMAPAQSYLDIHSPNFSRYVNLTEPERPWHNEFHYFGANVYSYVLAKYGDYIDFISVQFYESYSRAAMSVYHYGMSPDAYLQFYVNDLLQNSQSYFVDFEQDKAVGLASQRVSFPMSKLVFGFANGWGADPHNEKNVFFEPKYIQAAWSNMKVKPRGCMFWVIGEEGRDGVEYAKGLNSVLNIRKTCDSS